MTFSEQWIDDGRGMRETGFLKVRRARSDEGIRTHRRRKWAVGGMRPRACSWSLSRAPQSGAGARPCTIAAKDTTPRQSFASLLDKPTDEQKERGSTSGIEASE